MFSGLTNTITGKNYSKENNEWILSNIKKSEEIKNLKKFVKQVKKDLKNVNFKINEDLVVL